MSITVDEWLAELARVSARNDDGLTSQEWADRLDMGINTFKAKLRAANRLGWVKVGRRKIPAVNGALVPVPVYRIERPRKGNERSRKGNGRSARPGT